MTTFLKILEVPTGKSKPQRYDQLGWPSDCDFLLNGKKDKCKDECIKKRQYSKNEFSTSAVRNIRTARASAVRNISAVRTTAVRNISKVKTSSVRNFRTVRTSAVRKHECSKNECSKKH